MVYIGYNYLYVRGKRYYINTKDPSHTDKRKTHNNCNIYSLYVACHQYNINAMYSHALELAFRLLAHWGWTCLENYTRQDLRDIQ